MNKQSKILFIGEAMLELVNKDENNIGKSFAGDTYNSSVYLKRAFSQNDVAFMTAVGRDVLSNSFVGVLENENINPELIGRSEAAHLGAYMVLNDKTGERSFLYWRSQAAAKSMMTSLTEAQLQIAYDAVFFSGITLAILHDDERELFFDYIEKKRANGSLIIFDPNYRARLWQNQEIAKDTMQKAFELSDWLMPGVDDFADLYGLNDVDSCLAFCKQFGFSELVLKHGEKAVHVVNADGTNIIQITPSSNVVDTTSAGDAFNGVYIGARLQGEDVTYATLLASYAAKQVIETPGAIMPKEKFDSAWARKPSK